MAALKIKTRLNICLGISNSTDRLETLHPREMSVVCSIINTLQQSPVDDFTNSVKVRIKLDPSQVCQQYSVTWFCNLTSWPKISDTPWSDTRWPFPKVSFAMDHIYAFYLMSEVKLITNINPPSVLLSLNSRKKWEFDVLSSVQEILTANIV